MMQSVSLLLRLCGMLLALGSANVMAAFKECKTSTSAATCSGTLTFFVGCSFTAAVLEAAAVYLYLQLLLGLAADNNAEKEEKGISAASIVLLVVDLLVAVLLCSEMGAAYVAEENKYCEQMCRAGVPFPGEVEHAKILSLAACVAVTLAVAFRPTLN